MEEETLPEASDQKLKIAIWFQEFTNGPYVRRAVEKRYFPLVSKRKNIPPWSYPDAAAAGPAAATSAAASAVCI